MSERYTTNNNMNEPGTRVVVSTVDIGCGYNLRGTLWDSLFFRLSNHFVS